MQLENVCVRERERLQHESFVLVLLDKTTQKRPRPGESMTSQGTVMVSRLQSMWTGRYEIVAYTLPIAPNVVDSHNDMGVLLERY